MKRITLLLSLLAIPACDSNVDAAFKGEPLISLRGEVLKPATAIEGDLEVALVWYRFTTEGDQWLAASVPIDGSFPAKFVLDVNTPPPDDLLNHFEPGDAGVAVAYIVAVPAGTDLGSLDEVQLQGGVENALVAYTPAEIAADSAASAALGGPLKAGVNLLQSTPPTEAEITAAEEACAKDENACGFLFDRLSPVPADTLLELTLGVFEVPNFT